MSQSKFIMAKKLCKVQKRLMEVKIEEFTLENLLPLIFQECLKENLTFWFNFIEDAAVLNIRDIEHENYELNIRNAYPEIPIKSDVIDSIKINLLINSFLLTGKPHEIDGDVASSADNKIVKHDQPIKQSNAVPPTSIRTVIDMLEKNGEPVTRKTIQEYLQMDKMSTDNRRRCIAYLKSMEE